MSLVRVSLDTQRMSYQCIFFDSQSTACATRLGVFDPRKNHGARSHGLRDPETWNELEAGESLMYLLDVDFGTQNMYAILHLFKFPNQDIRETLSGFWTDTLS